MKLETVLSVLGPLLTTSGAALLAYDVLRGPARMLRAQRHAERLEAAEQRHEDVSLSLAESSDERSARAQTVEIAAIDARLASATDRAETANAHAKMQEGTRAYRLAIGGLLLVAAGGVAQAIAAILVAVRQAG